ncbi:MAG: ornithine cyclodeaminase family protein [Alphaproteobacteria bacterium]
MLILTNDEIEKLLDMGECIAALEGAYRDFGNRDAVEIPRQDLLVENPRPGAVTAFKTMSGSWPQAGITALRLNSDIVSWPVVNGEPRRVKLPVSPGNRYNGMVILFSTDTGTPLCMFTDGVMQKTRVGGSSGVAAKYLSREESKVMGLLGSGWQAGAQVDAMCAVRPLELIKVFSPTAGNREQFAKDYAAAHGIEVRAVDTPEEAVADVDILVSATNSMTPTIRSEWVLPGMHVTSIRGSEIPLEVLQKADKLVVNSSEPVSAYPARGWPSEVPEFENGDYSRPDIGVIDFTKVPELRDVVAGHAEARGSADEITCFHNYKGLGLQFAALGSIVYGQAVKQGIGLKIDDDYFTQTVHP